MFQWVRCYLVQKLKVKITSPLPMIEHKCKSLPCATSNEYHSAPPQGYYTKRIASCCYILWKDTMISSSNFPCNVPFPRDPQATVYIRSGRGVKEITKVNKRQWPVRGRSELGVKKRPEPHWLQQSPKVQGTMPMRPSMDGTTGGWGRYPTPNSSEIEQTKVKPIWPKQSWRIMGEHLSPSSLLNFIYSGESCSLHCCIPLRRWPIFISQERFQFTLLMTLIISSQAYPHPCQT